MKLLDRLRARLRRRRVAVWYHRDYAAPALALSARVDHVDPDRGARIVGRLLADGLIRAVDVRTPPAASVVQLRRFHSMPWIERSGDRDTLGRVFGLPASDVDAETLLASSKRAVGGTIMALQEVARGRLEVAVNLGGGFHHAEPELGSGFCVYNDIGVGIAELRRSGWTGRVAIVDLDFHQGNGNTIAFVDDPTVLVYSIHGAVWTRAESAGHEHHLTGPVNDRRYLGLLRTTLETTLRRFRPNVVVYIAGADVLAGDRLGSFWLSPRGVLDRDAHVAEVTRRLGAGLVVTLGGGYSEEAWRAHYRMTRAHLTGRWSFDARARPSLRHRFADVASALDVRELRGELESDDIGLTEEDVLGSLAPHGATHRFLDFYSSHGVEVAFERYGIMDRLRKRGFTDLEMELDPSDRLRQVLRVWGASSRREGRLLLIELVIRRRLVRSFVPELERMEVLFVEWLLLQDPTKSFRLARPPLPGQEHPGLGLALHIQELLLQACRRLDLAGLMDRPAHYHNAHLCSEEWRFVDPLAEGRYRAIRAVLADRDLYEASRLVEDRALFLANGEPVPWLAVDHVFPVSEPARRWFASDAYRSQVRKEKARLLDAGLHARRLDPTPAEAGS